MQIDITNSWIGGGTGDGGALVEGDDLVVVVECTNNGYEDVVAELGFNLNGTTHSTAVELGVGQAGTYEWPLGPLAAGGYDISIYVTAETESSSEVLSDTGMSFMVGAAAVLPPILEISWFNVTTDSNVALPDDAAWTSDNVTVWTTVRNLGADTGPITIGIWSHSLGDGVTTQLDSLGMSGEEQLSWLAGQLPAGTHDVVAYVSGEQDGRSEVFVQADKTLTISDVAVGEGEDWREIDLSMNFRAFDGGPLTRYTVLLTFDAPGESGDSYGGDSLSSGGTFDLAGVRVAPSFWMHIQAVPEFLGAEPIEHTQWVTVTDPTVVLQVTQEPDEAKATARNLEGAREKAGISGEAGLDFKVVSIGGSAASEEEINREYEVEVEWTFLVPKPSFILTAVQGATVGQQG